MTTLPDNIHIPAHLEAIEMRLPESISDETFDIIYRVKTTIICLQNGCEAPSFEVGAIIETPAIAIIPADLPNRPLAELLKEIASACRVQFPQEGGEELAQLLETLPL